MNPCPVCRWPAGFHDHYDKPASFHRSMAAAVLMCAVGRELLTHQGKPDFTKPCRRAASIIYVLDDDDDEAPMLPLCMDHFEAACLDTDR